MCVFFATSKKCKNPKISEILDLGQDLQLSRVDTTLKIFFVLCNAKTEKMRCCDIRGLFSRDNVWRAAVSGMPRAQFVVLRRRAPSLLFFS